MLGAAAVLPLSFGQEGLWFFEQLTPGTPTYNVVHGWRLNGPLDVRLLQKSLDEVVRRHPPLRTVFGARNGTPVQIIFPAQTFPMTVVDLRAEADPAAEAQRLAAAEARRPFDLATGPLIRVTVLRVGEEEHVMVVNMHHIISDAWSEGVLLRELSALYGAGRAGREMVLPELPIDYGDFVVLQRETAHGSGAGDTLAYWQKLLQEPPPPLALPTDHPRLGCQTHRGTAQFFNWPAPFCRALKELSRREAATLFRVLLAGFAVLLERYTRQDDLIIGAPFAGRMEVETEGLIGYFVNVLPLRVDLHGNPPFTELLQRTAALTLGASMHQAIPLKHVLAALGTARGLDRNALFQVALGLQGDFTSEWSLPGVTATRLELDSGSSRFDLTVLATESRDGLRFRFEYNTDLFSAETIDRMAGHFQTLLESAVAAPRRRIGELALTSPAERSALWTAGHGPVRAYERDRCIHEIFEAEAAKAPDAVALVCGSERVTYGEINERADRLSRRLLAAGAGPDAPVGVYLDRSIDMVVGLLAILKAGGAYLPLDRSYPPERLAFMLKDAQAKLALTRAEFAGTLARTPVHWVCVDGGDDRAPSASPPRAPRIPAPTDLACVLYTSGSTGEPKGVEVPHRGIVRLVRNSGYVEFSRQDVFLQLAVLSFDAASFEIWGPLLNGAKLVIAPPGRPTFEELGRIIQREGVTTLWLTASLFNQMIDHHVEGLRGVRQLVTGGEALSVPHVLTALRELPGCQLINGYGPTEGATFTCCHRIRPDWPGGATVPIGRPIGNTTVLVLDSRLEPAPVGVPGELYIGGDGLARGYLNRPGLTVEKFVPVPVAGAGPARYYRTGDLVRWMQDGNLEFLGRLDGQVKIRGFRVEPGEVEAALSQHPAVEQCVVIARADPSGSRQLVAYFSVRPGATVLPIELRDFLGAKLPAFCVPAHFVPLREFPLTATGKLDRQALPAPEAVALPARQPVAAPSTSVEKSLAEIWRGLLGRGEIGVNENFFHLGGHSLLAMQMTSRIARNFGVELPVRSVFESPTIAGLSRLIADATGQGAAGVPAIVRRGDVTRAEGLLARLDKLSEKEVEELLSEFEEKPIMT